MPRGSKSEVIQENRAERAMRDQEVVRANKELAAYFKGRRTEREARAALKIIKAFIRDRERADPKGKRPLPGLERNEPAGMGKRQGRAGRKGSASRSPRRRPAEKAPAEPPLEQASPVVGDGETE